MFDKVWPLSQKVPSYLRLAGAQTSGDDCLMSDNDPVGESVHFVIKLGVTLQVGLHLSDFVQQLVGHLVE